MEMSINNRNLVAEIDLPDFCKWHHKEKREKGGEIKSNKTSIITFITIKFYYLLIHTKFIFKVIGLQTT